MQLKRKEGEDQRVSLRPDPGPWRHKTSGSEGGSWIVRKQLQKFEKKVVRRQIELEMIDQGRGRCEFQDNRDASASAERDGSRPRGWRVARTDSVVQDSCAR